MFTIGAPVRLATIWPSGGGEKPIDAFERRWSRTVTPMPRGDIAAVVATIETEQVETKKLKSAA
jgi:hypothetical protein